MDREQAANGVNRCVSCGSSDVSFDGTWLVCAYCHHRWNTAVVADELHLSEGIENLVGTAVLGGAKDIDTSSLVTVECDGCGASISINSEASLSVTCHWCRHVLSLNHPVDNGAIPDAILPFYITREDAAARMAAYVSTRTTFANEDFLRDFAAPTLQAVYLPYLVADGNVTVRLDGQAWVQRGSSGGSEAGDQVDYTTEVHTVMREADVLVDDLAIEARSTRTKLYAAVSTTNIINAIQPFDVEHAVRFNAQYIAEGVAFEKRDIDMTGAMGPAADLFATLVRGYVNQTLSAFTGGVRWEHEQTSIKGTRWISVLLPVWLYSFEESTADGPMMHYIAVNGRTGDTEGSVPVGAAAVAESAKKWGRVAAAIFATVFGLPFVVVPLVLALAGAQSALSSIAITTIVILVVGAISFGAFKLTSAWRAKTLVKAQRNPDARLKPEFETKYTPTRLEQSSLYLGKFTHGGGPEIRCRNDHQPQVRAADSRVSFGDAPVDPCAGTDPVADFAFQEKRGWHLEADGGPVIGWHMTAPPPGNPAAQGWRDDTPVLNRMWARHFDGGNQTS
jgi:hypothetical protein